ncbi:hypothetical protein ABKA04_005635 [Annulohypoxylon sp. FPYF3050]
MKAMASTQLMQEELQQSVVLSEEDAEFEEDMPNQVTMAGTSIPHSNDISKPQQPFAEKLSEEDPYDESRPEEFYKDEVVDDNEVHAVAVDDMVPEDEEELDLEEEPAEEDDAEQDEEDSGAEDDIHDDDDAFDVDAEGEDEEELGLHPIDPNIASSDEDDADQDAAEEDDENEGVGAVKIKPGDTDEESDSEDEVSLASGSSDRESAAEWEDAVDNDDEEEEDSDVADPNTCIFCKKDEEHDPSEEFESYLTCKGCGEHDASNWRCPDCARDEMGSDSEVEFDHETAEGDHDMELDGAVESDLSPTSTNRSAAPKITRDLLPTHRGINKPDSHSVFNQLVLDEDPMDGSRVLQVTFQFNGKDASECDRNEQDSAEPKTAKEKTDWEGSYTVAEPPPMAPFFPSSYSQPFYSFYDKEPDELKGKPYGGILTEEQADTTKTLPTKDDRRRFDEAKQKAEEEWRNRLLAMQAEAEVPVKKSRKASGPASQIECIEFGGWEIDTWYAAPYPEEYSRNRVLYICEFCLKYMNSDYVAWRHKLKCPAKHPPGDEIYRHGSISFFEVDGRKNPVYCQNLCLLAKLFLGSKTLYYDVEPFLFYVLCEYDDLGYHFVGYFSKEKRASSQNNVSCILTLPIHQRKGYGHLLIDFSYLLTKVEEKTGSPEKPLSDMGLVSYRNYWRLIICKYLIDHMPEDKMQKKGMSIRQISDDTGMTPDDVISALEALRFLVRDPVTQTYAFRVDLAYCHKEVAKWEAKKYVKLNPKNLTWMPYVMGRSNATNFELGPALNTIAPREEDEDIKAVQNLAESGIATGDFAITQPINQNPPPEVEPSVLESTEPNDSAIVEGKEDVKLNGIGKENVEAPGSHSEDPRASTSAAGSVPDDEDAWIKAYDNIPISRFQVFPAINNRRTAMSRLSSAISRPAPLPRMPPASARRVARPKVRRSTGSASVRKAAPKANNGKRKPGGTGRGPGRWPKGTKKSDYGNADSGPGLPPAWLEKQRQQVDVSVADENTQDTVQVQTEAIKSQKGKQLAVLSAKSESTVEESFALTNDANGDVVMGGTDNPEDAVEEA